jgi:hypothetical protein
MATKTLAMTMELFRRNGFEIGKVEQWIPGRGMAGGGCRRDLFGFIDAIAMPDSSPSGGVFRDVLHGCVAVQACGTDVKEHMKKIQAQPLATNWLRDCGPIVLVCWRRIKVKRGGKAIRWKPRVFVASVICDAEIDWIEMTDILV